MQNSLPIVSIAKSEVCATKLEDKVLQMQTLIGLPYDDVIIDASFLTIDGVTCFTNDCYSEPTAPA